MQYKGYEIEEKNEWGYYTAIPEDCDEPMIHNKTLEGLKDDIRDIMSFEYEKLSNIVIEGIDRMDHPEYSDAYIAAADYNGKPMSEEELEKMSENCPEFAGWFLHE